jgi:dUTP pyrophosphatase
VEQIDVYVLRSDGALLPDYATPSSSGMDLRAHLEKPVELKSMARALIPTGIRVGIPNGSEAQIRPRSGLAYQFGITVLNTPGTIDADYRGEIKVLLINFGADSFVIHNGDRIAQMVFQKTLRAQWQETGELPDTVRAEGGFGSTGRR